MCCCVRRCSVRTRSQAPSSHPHACRCHCLRVGPRPLAEKYQSGQKTSCSARSCTARGEFRCVYSLVGYFMCVRWCVKLSPHDLQLGWHRRARSLRSRARCQTTVDFLVVSSDKRFFRRFQGSPVGSVGGQFCKKCVPYSKDLGELSRTVLKILKSYYALLFGQR